jgi:hypothetical protein
MRVSIYMNFSLLLKESLVATEDNNAGFDMNFSLLVKESLVATEDNAGFDLLFTDIFRCDNSPCSVGWVSGCTLKTEISEMIRNSDINDPHNTEMHCDVWIIVVILSYISLTL